jgi:hypothetical protein
MPSWSPLAAEPLTSTLLMAEPTDSDVANDHGETIARLVDDSLPTEFAAHRLSINTVFDVLANPGRRYVLTYLVNSEGYATVTELVDYVVENMDTSMTERGFRKNVLTELREDHLPELDESGLITYNIERQIVSSTDLTPVTVPYLEVALEQQQQAKRIRQRTEDEEESTQ